MQAIEEFVSPDLPITLMSSDICAVLASIGMTGIGEGVTYAAILKKCQEILLIMQGPEEIAPKLKRRRSSVAKPPVRTSPAGYVFHS